MANDQREPPESLQGPPPERAPMSRAAAFAAMGIVAFAILLLTMLTPGRVDHDAPPPAADGGESASAPVDSKDAEAVGKPAPLHFTLKDMNGIDVKLSSFK